MMDHVNIARVFDGGTTGEKDEGGRMKDEKSTSSGVWSYIRHPFSSFILHPSSFHELDWIVMKCLEKDRNRRYETANGFAVDLQRYLAGEAVEACPPSRRYRLRKFVHRNKGPLVAASLVAAALLAGVVGTSIGLVAAQKRAEGERQAKDTAERRLAQIEKGIDILGAIFDELDPAAEDKEGRPLRAILGDRLDQAAAALEGEAVGDSLVVARLQDRLGRTYLGLGHPNQAESLFTKAVTTLQSKLGPDDPLTLASLHNQARAFEAAGKRIEATNQFEQLHAAQVRVLGADHLDTLSTLNELAVQYRGAGKTIEAIPLLEQVRDGRVKQLGRIMTTPSPRSVSWPWCTRTRGDIPKPSHWPNRCETPR